MLRRVLVLTGFYVTLTFDLIGIVQGRTTESPLDRLQGPIFISEPPSSLAFANSKGSLVPCTAFGRPAPVLDWIKSDGSSVENIYNILEILPNNTLYFYPFEQEKFMINVHDQTYRCTASNDAGSIVSRSMSVKAVLVEQYRSYNLQLSDVWAQISGTAIFRCVINPVFAKEYIKVVRWTQGTKRIKGDRVSILSDGELHIRDIRAEDRFTPYACVAKNILTGEEKSSDVAYLHTHEAPAALSSPKKIDTADSITVEEGGNAELPCVGTSNPLPTYRWLKDGKIVQIDNYHNKQNGGNLLILSARVSDSGYYVCNISNKLGSAISTTQFIVKSSLVARIDPPSQVVDSGQSASFNCSISGHPIKTIQWYKNGQQIRKSDPHYYIQSETLLQIDEINRQDQGMYQCIISNDGDNSQATSQLLIGAAHPTFIDQFVDQYVQTGQRTSLRCSATGTPTPNITWTLDDGSIPDDPNIRVGSSVSILGDVVSYVNISSIKIVLGGEYKCLVGNEVGHIEHTGRVNVYGVPYVREMKNVTATANEQLSIRCYVAGYPVTSITWSKNGYTLPQNHLQKVINGTLTIEKVQKLQDTGEYVCTARNTDDQGMSRSVFISVLEPPVIDSFHFPRKKQGDRIVVSCVVSSGDQPLDIRWLKDGLAIPPDMGIMIQKLGTFTSMLVIGDASPRHNGNYTCSASNAAASINLTSPLHVDVPPRWVIEPSDQYVVLKKSVSLDCLTAGTPEPQITWKKARGNRPGNYRLIQYVSSDDETVTDHLQKLSNGTLVIHNAVESDHGYYLCHSTNGVGLGLSKVIFLTVHIPARFDAPSKNYTIRKGKNLTMDCQAIGDKPLSIAWSFNAQSLIPIPNNRREIHTINTNRGKLSQLSLRPSRREDTGFYVCTAKNKFGVGALPMRLTVLEPPEPPRNTTLLRKDSRNLTLGWLKPYNGNSELISYIIQYKIDTGVWQGVLPNITVASSKLKATITKLHPSYVYHVRVIANNSIGYSRPSIVLEVRMDEESPSGPPENVKVKAIGSEKLKISWMPPKPESRNGLIKGYYIGYKETKSPYNFIYEPKVVDGKFTPELTIEKLNKFTEYTVHVQAYNDQGRGPSSRDTRVYTLEDVPSQPPKGVQASSINSQSIKVLWSPPPRFTLHGILQGYKIIYKPVRHDEDESDADTVTTNELGWTLTGLAKFTNYSLQVLAYTRKGEGVRSSPIYVRTMQDKPERPADIKALPVNSTSILVSWKPPLHKNGILTKYSLYYQNSSKDSSQIKLEIPSRLSNYRFVNLSVHMEYRFRISASTFIGEGETTHSVKASPINKVGARIASFSEVMTVPWRHTVKLPCLAVGNPTPSVVWTVRGMVLRTRDRIKLMNNGSLHIEAIVGSDAANYTCRATNIYGSDEITFAISVQAPPKAPRLDVVATTSSTIQVNWRSGSNGGSPIIGFTLKYKKEHEVWTEIKVGSTNRTYTAMALLCGTSYRFFISAHNALGKSPNTEIVSAKTNGSTPIMPAQSLLLKSINVTHVDLNMSSWQLSGCPIKYFSIKYQVWNDETWTQVANNVNRNTTIFTVLDLHPATWYKMIVTAHSDAGNTECQLKFATLTYHGSTITPIIVAHKLEAQFYEKTYVMIPLCAGIVAISVVLVGVLLYCKRRREILRFKERSINIRRDITAETSLMNDLDKQLNHDLDSSSGNSELFGKRNVNLLISLNSDDNIHGNCQAYLIHDNSNKTNSDNLSFGRSDDDGNINPYATFNELKEVFAETNELGRTTQMSDEFDEISLEKAQAQKAMLTPAEAYVPFFQTKGDKSEVLKDSIPLEVSHEAQSRLQGYDNQGLVLSPRKYASADQIHALFTQAPPRPHSTYGKSKSGSHGSSDEKGSQRHSLISSVTTVSSSRDELLEALENAKRNPPPPVVYESPPESSSQPTDSSGTEPGIVQFTQSPPKPNEQREAACELPAYNVADKQKRPRKLEPESESTECETTEVQKKEIPQPRKRGRHRGKQRGHISVKRQLLPSVVPRTLSRTSTTSSEEVTYTFGGRDSPHSNSPSDGYLSYKQGSQGFTESDYGTKRTVGGRRTPHGRARYSTSIQTPGTDESRPLVRSIVQQTMASPAEEDEDSVSLLDRYYRPVEDSEGQTAGINLQSGDKGYTEDFTIV